MVETAEDLELFHYGVKGMRWGVTRSDEQLEKAETARENKAAIDKQAAKELKNAKRAEKYKARSLKSQEVLNDLDELGIKSPRMRELYGRSVDQSDRMFAIINLKTKKKALAEEIAAQQRLKDIADKDAANVEKGKLSRGQKIAVGAGVAAVALVAAYGIYAYPDIKTHGAEAGESISVRNFMKRYDKRVDDFTSNPINKDMFNAFSDEDTVISSGSIFKRLTAYSDESLDRRLYTTVTDADHDKYQGLYGPMLKKRTGQKDLFISEMTTSESIRSPSKKKRVQILIDMLNENETFDSPDGEKSARRLLEDMQPISLFKSAALPTDVSDTDSNETAAFKLYNMFSRNLVTEGNTLGQKYMERIEELGYNALVDDNDAGLISDLPMILLNPKKSVSSRKFTPHTREREKEARKRLVEIL